MFKMKVIGILVIILIFGLYLTGCSSFNSAISKITGAINWTVEQEGSTGGVNPQGTTTRLKISFNSKVNGLAAEEVEIEGAASIDSAEEWKEEGNTWIIPVIVSESDSVSVKITRPGIMSGTRYVKVYKSGVAAPVSYTAEANGGENLNSTVINFVFDEAINDLAVGDITLGATLSLSSGSATRETLSGGGTDWALTITAVTQGDIRVTVKKPGISSTSRTVTIFKTVSNTYNLTGLSAYNGQEIMVGLFDTKDAIGTNTLFPPIRGLGTITNLGTARVSFFEENGASWNGAGSKYVCLIILNGNKLPVASVGKNTVNYSSSAKNPSIIFNNSNFEEYAFRYTFGEAALKMGIEPDFGASGLVLDDFIALKFPGRNYDAWVNMVTTEMYRNTEWGLYNGGNQIKADTVFFLKVPLDIILKWNNGYPDHFSGYGG